MTRKIKVIGLALLAVGAFTAFSATTASATSYHFTAGGAPTVTGSKVTNHIFKTDAGTVSCTTAHFKGQTVATTTDLTLAMDYNGCTAFGFVNVPIHENGCTYTFTAHQTVPHPGGTTVPFTVHLTCAAGKAIEITAPGCTTKVGPQSLTGLTPTNQTNTVTKKMHMLVHINVPSIKYDECGSATSNGTYTGSVTVSAETHAGEPVDITYTPVP